MAGKAKPKAQKADAVTTTEEPTDEKVCFIATPLGEPGSEERRAADGLVEAVIRPTLMDLGFKVVAPLDISSSGDITRHIIKHLLEDDLVVANMTGPNANVMYELAIRHCVRKPVVMLSDDVGTLPFDIQNQRTIPFVDDMAGGIALRKELIKAVEAVMEEAELDNPVYKAAKFA